jgi:uncharacterized RDD family membrane protein YckC
MKSMAREIFWRRVSANVLNSWFASYPFPITIAIAVFVYPEDRLLSSIACVGLTALQLTVSFRMRGAFGTLAVGLEVRSVEGGRASFEQWLARSGPYLVCMGCVLAKILAPPQGPIVAAIATLFWAALIFIIINAVSLLLSASGRTLIDRLSGTEVFRPEWHRLAKPNFTLRKSP